MNVVKIRSGNMSGFIDRQAAIDALEREKTYSTAYKDGYTQTDYFKQYNMGLTDGIKALHKLPSADVQSVRHGHWVKKWHTIFKEDLPCCSVCKNFMAFRWDYCPNCGATMDGEQDE